jgi:hypothetical protein
VGCLVEQAGGLRVETGRVVLCLGFGAVADGRGGCESGGFFFAREGSCVMW